MPPLKAWVLLTNNYTYTFKNFYSGDTYSIQKNDLFYKNPGEAHPRLKNEWLELFKLKENIYDALIDTESNLITKLSNMQYRMPPKTRNFLVTGNHISNIKNYKLQLEVCAPFEGGKFHLFNRDSRKLHYSLGTPAEVFTNLKERQKESFNTIYANPANKKDQTFTTRKRLMIGMGDKSIYDVGITLHHLYGFPYLPASGIQGAVRNTVINHCFENETAAIKNLVFKTIFGNTDTMGCVDFFDAYPETKPTLEADIMNPHYKEYYGDESGHKPPADYDTPVPIQFITIKPGAKFSIKMAWNELAPNNPLSSYNTFLKENGKELLDEKGNRIIERWHGKEFITDDSNDLYMIHDLNGALLKITDESSALDVAWYWLHFTLYHSGLGGKTSRGYGKFEKKSELTNAAIPGYENRKEQTAVSSETEPPATVIVPPENVTNRNTFKCKVLGIEPGKICVEIAIKGYEAHLIPFKNTDMFKPGDYAKIAVAQVTKRKGAIEIQFRCEGKVNLNG